MSQIVREFEKLHVKLAHTLSYFGFLTKARSLNLIPKGFQIKAQYNSHRSSIIIDRAARSLIKERIQFHCGNKYKLLKHITEIQTLLSNTVDSEELKKSVFCIESMHDNISKKLKETHETKLQSLISQKLFSFGEESTDQYS